MSEEGSTLVFCTDSLTTLSVDNDIDQFNGPHPMQFLTNGNPRCPLPGFLTHNPSLL